MSDNRMITVCSSCKRATCWQYIFLCDDYIEAGTVDIPVSEAIALDLEHLDYIEEYAFVPAEPEPPR